MGRWMFALAVILTSTAPWAGADPEPAQAPTIWGKPVMPQPFERAPFREIAIPKWVTETAGVGYTLSGMSSEARQRAAAAGVAISEMGFVDPWYVYYDSAILKRRSPHVPPERLGKDIAEYKRLGVRILGVVPPGLVGEVYEKHPDWRRVAKRGEAPAVDTQKHPEGGGLCLLGPWGDQLIDVLAEILTKFPDVDAFSFDGLHYGGYCYCEHCRENYRKDTGREIPEPDMENVEFRRYQHWADRRMESLIQRMQQRLKGIKPEVALVTWTTNAGRWGHFLSIPRNMPARMNLLLDAPDQELWLDETNRGNTIAPAFGCAYAWSVTNHRVAFSEPYLMSHGNPYGKDGFPPEELHRRMMLVLTYGGFPSIAVGQPGRLQQAVYGTVGEVNRLKPWLIGKEPDRWAAVVMSDNTKTFYGRQPGKVEERYLSNVLGTFRAAVEEHLPVTVINDWNLNERDLSAYKVLVLPNTACMDDAQVAAVTKFVESGGGLVASVDASCFDEFGEPRMGFGLGRVLGLTRNGLTPKAEAGGKPGAEQIDENFAKSIGPDYWEKRKNVFDFRLDAQSVLQTARLADALGGGPVTFKGQAAFVRTDAPGAKAGATITVRDKAGSPPMPGIVTRTFGKGRVVYFAAGVDSAYYLYPYPYQRMLLTTAIRWAAGGECPVSVKAPMCVHATFFRQARDGKRRLVVQLFNDANTAGNHAMPNDDVPLREETLPVHGIELTFREEKIGGAFEEPEHRKLDLRRGDDGAVTIVLPRLEVHSLIALDLVQ